MNKKKNASAQTGLEIAVIGMAGRFPGAGDIETFWENIKNGVESVAFFSDDELVDAGIDPAMIEKPNYVKAKGYVEDVEYFDAAFFNYTPQEAEIMDPQVRIFHQCTYHALENAGYDTKSYTGLIGLYAGYAPNISWKIAHLLRSGSGLETMEIGNLNNNHFTSNICYKLNLKGPAVSINTTCSTSLAAVHMACRALLTGEADMTLAGGVALTLPTKTGYVYEDGSISSPDGRSRPFDAQAKGMSSGNGVGVVVLKRLVKAVKDGDHIYAVIKGSAINNDGNRKAGYTAPSVEGQTDVIRAALRVADIDAANISYVETHGTGTPIGDTIEIEALKKIFIPPDSSYKKRSTALGFVKANIGHTDCAAGVISFIKTVLAVYHRLIPPAINFETPNPAIDFDNSPFYINTQLEEWRPPVLAGVSAYGIGGTNAHIILAEKIPSHGGVSRSDGVGPSVPQLIVLSAKTRAALDEMTKNLAAYLETNPGIDLGDVAYTLQAGRGAFDYRRMVVCRDKEEAIAGLLASGPAHMVDYAAVSGKSPVEEAEFETDLKKAGELWLTGAEIDWTALHAGERRNRAPLPCYPFEKQQYNVDSRLEHMIAQAREGGMEFVKQAPLSSVSFKNRPEMKTAYVPPRNKAEEILVGIWQDLLGIMPIGIHDELPEIGVDSLKGMMFVNRFKEQLGEIIDVTGVFEAPTIAEFAVYFTGRFPESNALTGGAITAAPEIPSNFVMLHRPSGGAGNLFLVHEILGDVGAYLEFCKQSGTNFNCWGVEAEKLKNFTPQNVTIEEISARYIRQIKQIQPEGPYYLCTWSFGGNFGIEMALQLEQMGEELAFLAFFDCSGPTGRTNIIYPEHTLETEKAFLKDFFLNTGNEADLGKFDDMYNLWIFAVDYLNSDPVLVEGLRQFLIENEKALPNYHSLTGEELVQYLNINRTFNYAGSRYIPAGKIHTPLHYFRVEDNPEREDYWGDYCHTPVIYHEISGDHHSIFRNLEHIAEFAGKFNKVLNEICEKEK